MQTETNAAPAKPAHGLLALRYCGVSLPLQVLRSAPRHYYIGTQSAEDGPVSRESVEYFATEEEALEALAAGHWTQRAHP